MTTRYIYGVLALAAVLLVGYAWYAFDTGPEAAQVDPFVASTGAETPRDMPAEQVPAACPEDMTPAQAEGPYYTVGSPERDDLTGPDIPGETLILRGYVYDQECQPVAGAWLDFWQTDGNGVYDNTGYRLRGQQYTDDSGLYSLRTVVPGAYTSRTSHIHVKVRAAEGSPTFTSQLYFPDAVGNLTDSIFNQSAVVTLDEIDGQRAAYFNFKIQQ